MQTAARDGLELCTMITSTMYRQRTKPFIAGALARASHSLPSTVLGRTFRTGTHEELC